MRRKPAPDVFDSLAYALIKVPVRDRRKLAALLRRIRRDALETAASSVDEYAKMDIWSPMTAHSVRHALHAAAGRVRKLK